MDETVVASPEPLIDAIEVPTQQPAPAAEDQKAPPAATDENAEVETPEQQEAKKQSRNQRRFERQKTARIQAETEARLLRERNAQLEAQLKPQPSGEPQRDQYEDYEQYLRAAAKYDAAQTAAAALDADRKARQGSEQQSRANAGQAELAKNWVEREKAFQAATKDYEEVVGPYVDDDLGRLSDVARRAIVDSEVGPQMLYHLATNTDVAESIADLSPRDQKAELLKLGATLKAPAGKKVSNAPAPIRPVSQGRSATTGFSENDSQAEYEAKRKAQGARWAR